MNDVGIFKVLDLASIGYAHDDVGRDDMDESFMARVSLQIFFNGEKEYIDCRIRCWGGERRVYYRTLWHEGHDTEERRRRRMIDELLEDYFQFREDHPLHPRTIMMKLRVAMGRTLGKVGWGIRQSLKKKGLLNQEAED